MVSLGFLNHQTVAFVVSLSPAPFVHKETTQQHEACPYVHGAHHWPIHGFGAGLTIGSVHPGSVDPPGGNSNRLPLTVLRPGNQIDQGVVIHSGSLRREPREPTEPLSPKTDGEYG